MNKYAPKYNGTPFSTKMSACSAALLGYAHYNGVGFSKDEIRALEKVYGFDLKAEEHELMRAGSTRNLFRHVELDGLRVMALLGKYLEEGEDPVWLVAEGLSELGYAVALEDNEDD